MSEHPHWGHTKLGMPVHARVMDHHKGGFNKKIALTLTARVGTMGMFWWFNVLSLLSLPATLVLVGVFAAPKAGPLHFFLTFGWIYLITWICQNYIQLVLLPALMVGQNLQNEASDARSAKSFEDTELIADRLDTHTQGGITEILAAVGKLGDQVADLAQAVQVVMAARAPAKRLATQAERGEGTGA